MTRPAHILIVDDEVGTTRVLAAVLEDAGYRVEVVTSGRSALEAFASAEPDLVLLDFLMPQMDGAAALGAIRKLRPDVPVIMMSGVAESIVRRRARARFDAFLRKPFGLDELLDATRAALASKPKHK